MIYFTAFIGLIIIACIPLKIWGEILFGLIFVYCFGWLLSGFGAYAWISTNTPYLSLIGATIPCFIFFIVGMVERVYLLSLFGLFFASCHFSYFLSIQ